MHPRVYNAPLAIVKAMKGKHRVSNVVRGNSTMLRDKTNANYVQLILILRAKVETAVASIAPVASVTVAKVPPPAMLSHPGRITGAVTFMVVFQVIFVPGLLPFKLHAHLENMPPKTNQFHVLIVQLDNTKTNVVKYRANHATSIFTKIQ